MRGTARRESGFNPDAKPNDQSKHYGLYQYDPSTYAIQMGNYGTPSEQRVARSAKFGSNREPIVHSQEEKEFFAGYTDPANQARLQAMAVADRERRLQAKFGRAPTAGELYAQHLLGDQGGLDFLNADRNMPADQAVKKRPAVLKANKRNFYKDGHPRTVQETLDNWTDEINYDPETYAQLVAMGSILRSMRRNPLADYPGDPSPLAPPSPFAQGFRPVVTDDGRGLRFPSTLPPQFRLR